MGNANSGRKKQTVCKNGHDLTDPANVQIVKRWDGAKVERACRICARERSREWWRKNRGSRSA